MTHDINANSHTTPSKDLFNPDITQQDSSEDAPNGTITYKVDFTEDDQDKTPKPGKWTVPWTISR